MVGAVTALWVACAGGPERPSLSPTPTPPAVTALRLDGRLSTDSTHEIKGSGSGCAYRSRDGRLDFQTDAMTLSNGEVVHVVIVVASNASSGEHHSATAPLQEYGRAPVHIVAASTATSGAGNHINASRGEVVVSSSGPKAGLFYGSVEAEFSDGTHLSGVWVCRVTASS
jgi:hypothetical protein